MNDVVDPFHHSDDGNIVENREYQNDAIYKKYIRT